MRRSLLNLDLAPGEERAKVCHLLGAETKKAQRGCDMPFVYDQTEVEWPEDDSDPPPPRADQFVYIPPPEFGGAREPVHFSAVSIAAAAEAAELQQPQGRQPQVPTASQRRSLWDRLLGRSRPFDSPQQPKGSYAEERLRQEKLHEQRRQQLFAIAIPDLRQIGALRAYCRYDGGNDEGFAWLDRFEMQDGKRLTAAELAPRLQDVKLLDKLYAAQVMRRHGGMSDQQRSEQFIVGWLCDEWAAMLLGVGFGTGEYSMYGAFTVDLEACTIIDDPNADPIVQDIKIAK